MKDNHELFNVGLYLRLSREDENDGVSGSIQNQQDFLMRYLLQRGWNLIDVYADDGFTGTNFQRPSFERLIGDIENGRINCVITRDLSRLGRDYIMTGHYLEKYFPSKKVRYIAVNDGIDTFEDGGGNDLSPFRSVINDMYAKDISRKVRTALHTKKLNGSFIGTVPPYGYKKSSKDKHKLEPDPNTALVVRRIFRMFIEGNSKLGIANQLSAEKIPTPSQSKGLKATQKRHKGVWNEVIIGRILTNPTYIGNLTQNRSKKINYKVDHKVSLPKSDWIIVEGTHEAIVTTGDFNLAQQLSTKRNYVKRDNGAAHLLSGLVKCGTCGSPMTFAHESAERAYIVCSAWRKHPKLGLCTSHSYRESKVNARVIETLRKEALLLNKDKIVDNALTADDITAAQADFMRLSGQLEDIKAALASLYMDKVRGVITEEDFMDMSTRFNARRKSIAHRTKQLQKEENQRNQMGNNREQVLAVLEKFLTFKNIDRATIAMLINKVEILPEKDLKIHFNFPKMC